MLKDDVARDFNTTKSVLSSSPRSPETAKGKKKCGTMKGHTEVVKDHLKESINSAFYMPNKVN